MQSISYIGRGLYLVGKAILLVLVVPLLMPIAWMVPGMGALWLDMFHDVGQALIDLGAEVEAKG